MKRKRNYNYGNKKRQWVTKRRKKQSSEGEPMEEVEDENIITEATHEYCEDDVEMNEIVNLLPTVIKEIARFGFLQYLLMFFNLIANKKFDFSNICFLLFCDILRFWSTPTTILMRYPFKETKQFWYIGKILFHGRFQRFMTGYKNTGQSCDTSKGFYDPDNALINFAVPSHIHIETFNTDLNLPDIKGPGKFDFMVKKVVSTNPSNSFALTFDGKKMAPGLTTDSGDVDLLGYEEIPLKIKQDQFQTMYKQIMDLYDRLKHFEGSVLSQLDKNEFVTSLRYVSFNLSLATKDMRQLISKQTYALDKFILKDEKEIGKNYSYVIDVIKTNIYRAKAVISDALKAHNFILNAISHFNKSNEYVMDFCNKVDLSASPSFFNLKDHNSLKEIINEDEETPTHLIKQRTKKWEEIRAAFKVTGSKAHQALGLDGLKKQKAFFQEAIGQQRQPEPDFASFHG
ncbi:uncharacterized protein [Mytilus edulis]|uniref:uncharacterized protein n=1 Tax=Mytilus edulis TaxID=6550 RepID=UPI0039EF22E5